MLVGAVHLPELLAEVVDDHPELVKPILVSWVHVFVVIEVQVSAQEDSLVTVRQ